MDKAVENSREEAWSKLFREKYEMSYGMKVKFNTDNLRRALEERNYNSSESFAKRSNEYFKSGDIPLPFVGKTLRNALAGDNIRLPIAYGISVILKVDLHDIAEIPVKKMTHTDYSVQSFETAKALVWITIVAATASSAVFGVGLYFNKYDAMRGVLPLFGFTLVYASAAYARGLRKLVSPVSFQLALGCFFGVFSAVGCYVAVTIIDHEKMCDFSSYVVMGAVLSYIVSCTIAYPAGYALVAKVGDKFERLVVPVSLLSSMFAVVFGLILPAPACQIVWPG